MAAAVAAANRFARRPVAKPVLEGLLAAIKVRYGFQLLEPRERGPKWSVYGVVNPTVGVDTDADVAGIIPLSPLTPAEEALIRPIPGGMDQLARLAATVARRATPQEIAGETAPLRTALQLLGGGATLLYIGLNVRRAGDVRTRTEIDILTASEMIEVKTRDYGADDKLSGPDMTQFSRLRMIFKGTLKVVDDTGNAFRPPPRWVYQFTRPISPALYNWLKARDVTEVRTAV
jgi:hypothetical protein